MEGKRTDEEKVAVLPHTLVCIGIIQQLHGYRLAEEQSLPCVAEDTLNELEDTLFTNLFNEEQKLIVDKENCLEAFEEYSQLLAYATWLVYVTGKRTSPLLPLSSLLEEHEKHNRENAILIFLAQRLSAMPLAREMTGTLLDGTSQEAQRWLMSLLKLAEQLKDGEAPSALAGYLLARSNGNVYSGLGLAKEFDEDFLCVIQMANPARRFSRNFLSLLETSPANKEHG